MKRALIIGFLVFVGWIAASAQCNLIVSSSVTNVSCYGGVDGQIDLTVSGGTLPYTYNWSNSTVTEDQINLSADTFYCIITDSNGCVITDTAVIVEPTSLIVNAVTVQDIACIGAIGIVSQTTTGGSGGYTFVWSDSTSIIATASTIQVTAPGMYCVSVTDANGCQNSSCTTVNVLPPDTTYSNQTSCNPMDTGILYNTFVNQYGCDSVHVITTILNPAQAVIANNDSYFLFSDSVISGNLHDNDVFDTVSGVILSFPTNGTIVHNADGSFTYTPNPNFISIDSVIYSICNACYCDTATAYFEVSALVSVWPGDADYDGVADNNDILVLGQHYSQQDLARPNTNTNWQAQNAYAWQLNQLNGENLAHADCDGNGIIDTFDVHVIDTNYLLTHPKTDGTKSGTNPLTLQLSTDTVFAGDTIQLKVNLGNATTQVQNVYGIAYSINYDANIAQDSLMKMEFNPSWLTPNGNRISFFKPLPALGRIDIAQCRINGTNVSGYGEITSISIVIEDDLHGKDLQQILSSFTISNVRLIDFAGDEKGLDLGEAVILIIDTATATSLQTLSDEYVKIYPNPFENKLVVETELISNNSIKVFNVNGQLIYNQVFITNYLEINSESWDSGMYFIELVNDKKVYQSNFSKVK